ncbi:MAG: DUF4139 domain-containing protein [Armatimonadota bacterium]
MRSLAIIVGLALTALPVAADVDLTMVPERDEVELVVYGNQDVTIVRDRRTIGLHQGVNTIEFTWADTKIDPSSIKIRAVKAPEKVLIQQASYPPNRENTLVWAIEATEPGDYLMEVSYFTAGITWKPHYRVVANDDESKLQLLGAIELINGSGEDYGNARAKLVVGDLHLVQPVAELADKKRLALLADVSVLAAGLRPSTAPARGPRGEAAKEMPAAPPAVGMAGIGEYFIYAIEGQHDIEDGWRSRFAAISGPGVPVTVRHKYDPNRWGDAVQKFYVFRNVEGSTLGATPLARGTAYVLRARAAQGLVPITATEMPYTPIGEELELDVGSDNLVVVERKLMDYKKVELSFDRYDRVSGWDTEETFEIEVRNRSEKPIEIELFEHAGGVWAIHTDAEYEQVDKNTVKFPLTLASQTTKSIEFRISRQHGKNAEPK